MKKVIIVFFLLGSLVYANSLFNGFVWDDEEQIVKNTIIQSLANLPQILSGATFSTGGAGLSGWFFRPLPTLSYMFNYAIWQQNAFGFHLFQVFFHILNAILLFKILSLLLEDLKSKVTLFLSAVVSLIFLVHPAITEAVFYIAALSEVMYTFFSLLAFYLILKTQPKARNLLLVSSLLFLALLFKESAIVIFPIIVVYLFFYKRQDWGNWLFSLFGTLTLYLFIRLVLVQTPIRHPEFSPISEASLTTRLMTIPGELFSYLKIIFFPDKLAISQHFVVTEPSFSEFVMPLIVALVFAALLLFLARRLKSKLVLLGGFWFFAGFGFISNVFPLDMTIAERWLYFPLLGLVLILAEVLVRFLKERSRITPYIFLLSLFVVIALSLRTVVRSHNWRNGLTLYAHDIKISQDSFDLENNLGVELFRSGQYDEAKKHFERSLALQPKWYFAFNNLGAVYEREKNFEKAKELYQKTLETADYYLAYENLASVLLLGENNPAKAREFIKESLQKLPRNPKLWFLLALAEEKLGNREEAEQAYSVFLRVQQDLPVDFK